MSSTRPIHTMEAIAAMEVMRTEYNLGVLSAIGMAELGHILKSRRNAIEAAGETYDKAVALAVKQNGGDMLAVIWSPDPPEDVKTAQEAAAHAQREFDDAWREIAPLIEQARETLGDLRASP